MEAAVEQTATTGDQADGQTTTAISATVDYNGDHNGGGPKDITNNNNVVAKGKRTKRQRPQSPILFTFSSTNINNNDLTYYSPVSSSGFPAGSTTTEDEDTAESLILLSKGHSLDLFTSKRNRDDNYYDGSSSANNFKFNSKKYIESPSTGSGGGVYVYECKTCSRTFPSFQALGGHRASHRKPKNNDIVEIRKPQSPYKVVVDNYGGEPPPPPLQLEFPSRNNNINYSSMNNNNGRVSFNGKTIKSSSSKLHECSICGTEFNSGQALGGHMRRHRVAGGGGNRAAGNNTTTHNNNNKNTNNNNNNNNNTMLSLIPFGMVTNAEVYDLNNSRKNGDDDALHLGLDLNLPAPRETTVAATVGGDGTDHQQQQELLQSFALPPTTTENKETKEQPVVHLSATPTLVDCHY